MTDAEPLRDDALPETGPATWFQDHLDGLTLTADQWSAVRIWLGNPANARQAVQWMHEAQVLRSSVRSLAARFRMGEGLDPLEPEAVGVAKHPGATTEDEELLQTGKSSLPAGNFISPPSPPSVPLPWWLWTTIAAGVAAVFGVAMLMPHTRRPPPSSSVQQSAMLTLDHPRIVSVLHVNDLRTAVPFYQQLGFTASAVPSADNGVVVLSRDGQPYIRLVQRADHDGGEQVDIGCSNLEQIRGLLAAEGITVAAAGSGSTSSEAKPDQPQGCTLHDPSGNLVVLVQIAVPVVASATSTTSAAPAHPVTFTSTIYIRGTIDQVWQALTDPKQVSRYYMCSAMTIGHAVGEPMTYGNRGKILIEGTVTDYQPGKALGHTFHFTGRPDAATQVRYNLDSDGPLVALTLTHEGFNEENQTFADISGGWPYILSNLKTWVETGVDRMGTK